MTESSALSHRFRPDFISLFVSLYFFFTALIATAVLALEESGLAHEVAHHIRIATMLFMFLGATALVILLLHRLNRLHDTIKKEGILREELEQKLAAMESSMDGICIIDSGGKLTYMNRALMKLHAIRIDELDDYIGHSWHKLYNEEERKFLDNIVLQELRYAGYWKGKMPITSKAGKSLFSEMSLTLLSNGSIIGSVHDVTAQQNAEEEKEKLQKQFFQAQKMEAVGRLAGGIAHDFNNILSSITGYAEFLLEDLDNESKQFHFAWQIMQGSFQAKKLVEQILTFSRHNESARQVMDLVDSVHETIGMLRATVPTTIELKTCLEVDEAFIEGNITQITQNMMNLCVNGMDAIESKHGTLEIKLGTLHGKDCRHHEMLVPNLPKSDETPMIRLANGKNQEETILTVGSVARDRDYVCLSVIDTGVGMSRELMEHILEPFFTTKAVGKGTGLGLASVHGVMIAHRGAIVITSAPEKGSQFDLYFPLAVGAQSVIMERQVEESRKGSGRILVVEDQDNVRAMVTEMLKRMGYNSYACSSGFDAINHLQKHALQYDLILTDHIMPRVTGLELAETVNKEFPELPVIIISGYSKKKLEIEMEKNSSIRAVLRKPIDSHTLSRALNKAMISSQTTDQDKSISTG